jgi:uncharacterized repeat protein (TIGR03803 family)
LASFDSTDGDSPFGSLTLFGNTLYGTTRDGGAFGEGTVFSLNLDGSDLTAVASFDPDSGTGANPYGSLTLIGDTLYGTTASGGAFGGGTVFSVQVPEPSTVAQLGLAFVGLAATRRRRASVS